MLALMPGTGESAREQARAVVVYETAPAREHAMEFCRQLTGEQTLDIHWCSFDLLHDSASAIRAANKAGLADLILFSMTFNGDLPREVKLWIERWLSKRREREGALVGLILDRPPNVSTTASLKEIYLRHTAKRAGMDYLSHAMPSLWNAMPDSLDSFSKRAGQMTSVLDEILHTQPPAAPPPA